MKKKVAIFMNMVLALSCVLFCFVACGKKSDSGHDASIDGNWHTFERSTQKEATCTEEGLIKLTCTVCGYEKTESVAKLPHDYGNDGKCTVCGAVNPSMEDDDIGDSAFGSVTLSESGVLAWNKIQGASKYVISVTFVGESVPQTFDLNADTLSKDLNTLKDGGFPSGKSTVELTAYELDRVEIDGNVIEQEVPMLDVRDSFRVIKINDIFSLVRLKYSDAFITLDGFYSDLQVDGDRSYYLFEQILTNNGPMTFKTGNYIKAASGCTVIYYKTKEARANEDGSSVWSSTELAMGYPQIQHGDNMYYVRVKNGNDHKDYDLNVYGLYTVTVSRYARTFTEENGLRTNTDTLLSSLVIAERDIITQAVLFDKVAESSLGRDDRYSVVERADSVVTAGSAYPDAQRKVALNFYFYDEETVESDCAAYAQTARYFTGLAESNYGWTLTCYGDSVGDDVTVPDILVGKKVLGVSFSFATVKTIYLMEGATAFNMTFSECYSITDIWLPSTIAYMQDYSFGHGFGTDIPSTATIHCAFSRSYANDNFSSKWNYIAGTLTNIYRTVYDDYMPLSSDSLNLRLKDGALTVVGVTDGFSGKIPNVATVGGTAYPIVRIESIDYSGAVTIGKNVTEITADAFARSVSSVTVDRENTAFVEENGVLFTADKHRIIVAQKTLGELMIERNVESVDVNAFVGCDGALLLIKHENADALGEFDMSGACVVCGVVDVKTEGAFRAALTSNGKAVVIALVGAESLTDVTVPTSISGLTVARVTATAISGRSKVTQITIPDCVEYIDGKVFKDCAALQYLTVPFIGTSVDEPQALDVMLDSIGHSALRSVTVTSATALADNTFTGHRGEAMNFYPQLKTVVLPDTLCSIGTNAFNGCALTLYSDGGGLYLGNAENSKLVLMGLSDPSVDKFEIDGQTKIIYDGAFKGASALTELNIPSNIVYVGYAVMPSGCTFGVVVSDECNMNDWNADWKVGFNGDVVIGRTLISQDGEFKYSLLDGEATIVQGLNPRSVVLTVPKTVDGYTVVGISLGAFKDYTDIVDLTLSVLGDGESNRHLGYMFGAATAGDQIGALPENLTRLTILDSVSAIPANALYGCSSIEELIIPYVGTSKLVSSTSAEKHLGAVFGVQSVNGLPAFVGSTNVTVGNSVYYIPQSLSSVTVTDGGSINAQAFYNCTMLTTIVVESCGQINNLAFGNCSGLVTLKLPASATYNVSYPILNKACASLEYVELPLCGKTFAAICGASTAAESAAQYVKTVKVVDDTALVGAAFDSMGNLESVEISGSVQKIAAYAFNNCSALSTLILPSSLTDIERLAVNGCGNVASVIFGNISGWSVAPRNSTTYSALSSADLDDKAKAALYLSSTYQSYTWKRS